VRQAVTGPVVFISHFAVKRGKLDDLRRLSDEIQAELEADKPGTLAYLMDIDGEGSTFTVAHLFPDSDAMDRHFEGADERTAAAFELMSPRGWEIYGRPSDEALESMRQAARHAHVTLTLRPELVGGFLRLGPS
jgi:quinol monooxygenase YgiN